MRKPKRVVISRVAGWLGLIALAAVPASAHGTASGKGTVNAINAAEHRINITHDPIPELKWPGMTMDFVLSETVSIDKIVVGTVVDFQLHKKADGSFVIESLKVAKEAAGDPGHPHGH